MTKTYSGERAGVNAQGAFRFVCTGEFRCPRPGEWYLSGAIPCAYLAKNGSSIQFWILRPVRKVEGPAP